MRRIGVTGVWACASPICTDMRTARRVLGLGPVPSGSGMFVQAEDGIRDIGVPGVQTCALPILFGRNLLVLALHSLACLAGFIAKSSLPAEAAAYSGRWRTLHDRAGPAAIAFVAGATLFSLEIGRASCRERV